MEDLESLDPLRQLREDKYLLESEIFTKMGLTDEGVKKQTALKSRLSSVIGRGELDKLNQQMDILKAELKKLG